MGGNETGARTVLSDLKRAPEGAGKAMGGGKKGGSLGQALTGGNLEEEPERRGLEGVIERANWPEGSEGKKTFQKLQTKYLGG